MFDFTIPPGKNTPEVIFDSKASTLILKGKSYPENSKNFYDEIILHFKPYPFGGSFSITLDFDYISSSSVFSVLEFLKKMREFAPKTAISVVFFYDEVDDDMREIGNNYRKLTGLPVEMLVRA
jgi:hypothetical protein